MKQTYFLIAFILLTNFTFSQNVVFADPNFKQIFIKPWWDTNNDGEISLAEALNITSVLETTNVGITNLTGIESMPNVTSVIIRNNPVSAPVNLTSNTQLTNLTLHGTMTVVNITGLNLLRNINLDGPFLTLDVTNKPLLESLMIGSVDGNPLTGVQHLDVTGSPLLKKLWSQQTQLTSLNVTQNPLLEELVVGGNSINSINLTQNPLLYYLAIGGSPLGTIDLSMNPLLKYVEVSKIGISSLNIQNNNLIETLYASENNFTNNLNLSNLTLLKDLTVNSCGLTLLDLTNNTNLISLSITYNNLSSISLSHLNKLKNFSGGFNLFTSIDLSQNPNLEYVFLNNPKLKHINLKNGNNQNIKHHPYYYVALPELLGFCLDDPNSNFGIAIKSYVSNSVVVTANCTLSTNEFSKDDNFSLYPNPVDTDLYIKTDNELKSYQIYNQSGQLVDKGTFKENNNIVPMKTFSAGTYFITIITDKGIQQAKIIKK